MAYRKYVREGIFAYLQAPASTTVVTAGTYYPINGTFGNDPIESFSLVADPAIQYDGDHGHYFEIDAHANVKGDSNGMTITASIKKNGTLFTPMNTPAYLKTANEPQSMSGTAVVYLENGDKIQLVVTADGDGDVVTFDNITTTIRPFFRI